MVKLCVVCNSEFESKKNSISCSKKCRNIHRNNNKKETNKNHTVLRCCLFCTSEFTALKYKTKKFCNQSCSSKYNISNGNFNNWRLRSNGKTGLYKKCECCDNFLYIEPKYINSNPVRLCSKSCLKKHMSSLFSNGKAPMTGKHLTQEQKDKQKKTLLERYGIDNAFYLAKRRKISKPQMEIYDFIYEIESTAILEKFLPKIGFKYYADILIPKSKKIIEFNGDYWHCNPIKYSATYYHKVKNKLAEEIWFDDNKRRNIIESFGYTVLYIWEHDYKNNKQIVQQKIQEFLNDRPNRPNFITTEKT